MIVQKCIVRMIKEGIVDFKDVIAAYPKPFSYRRQKKLLDSVPCRREWVQVELWDPCDHFGLEIGRRHGS